MRRKYVLVAQVLLGVFILLCQTNLIYAAPAKARGSITYHPHYVNGIIFDRNRYDQSISKQLEAFLQANNSEEITTLIKAGIIKLNAVNSKNDSPFLVELMELYIYNDFDLPRLLPGLIKAGANVDTHGKSGLTPLYGAIFLNDENLQNAGLKGKDTEFVSILLKAGANVNTVLNINMNNGITTTTTPLISAIGLGKIDIVKTLLKVGADIKATSKIKENNVTSSMTVIQCASYVPNTAILSALIAAGADVNKAGKTNFDSITPLMIAVSRNDPDSVYMLINAKANVNAKDAQGRTALSMTTNPQIVSML